MVCEYILGWWNVAYQGVPQKKIKALGQGEGAGGGGTPFRMSKFFEILVSKWLSLSDFIASLAKSYVVKQCVKTPIHAPLSLSYFPFFSVIVKVF